MEQIDQTFVRESEEMNIIVKRTRLLFEEGKYIPFGFVG